MSYFVTIHHTGLQTSRQITLVPVSSDSMFRTMFENPYSVGLSLYMYHNFRSQTAVSLLNKYGAGISFDRVTTICNNIAHAVAQNITEYGVYVPPGLMRNKAIRASLDNVDKKVDTPDGKGSFHGTALAVYQRSGRGETVAKPVQITSKRQVSEVLHDVPPTVITMVKCTIEGNPKQVHTMPTTRWGCMTMSTGARRSMTSGGWWDASVTDRESTNLAHKHPQ